MLAKKMNPEIAAAAQARAKRYGQWSVKDEKLRITFKDSEESVLFEDTSSINYLKVENPNFLYMILGFVIGIILMVNSDTSDFAMMMGVFLIPFGLSIIIAFGKKIKYDNVAIETRGGKIIRFTVEAGKGKTIMEQIEEEKRKWEKNKK